jgi:2,5-diamino-6-(ribosylamino)-4(3H)-pyrimidinone 5'-phosphate reductase
MGSDRPRVVVSVSSSVDGRITLSPSRLLMDPANAAVWASLASSTAADIGAHDAVLEGSGSLVAADAGALELPAADGAVHEDFLPDPEAGHERWFVVVDGRGRVRWTMTRAGGTDLLVLVARSTPAAYLAYLRRENIPYLVAGDDRVDLGRALRLLQEKLGVTRVLAAGGGGINGALLRAGLIDEIHVLVLPAAIGGAGTPSVFDGPPLGDDDVPVRLRLVSAHPQDDGSVRLHYEVR